MTNTQFFNSSLSERVRLILRTGLFLNSIEYKNFILQLYSISDFFVEVKITQEGKDVESVRVISGEDLEKFVADITLPVNI